jgi:hypothetical protein
MMIALEAADMPPTPLQTKILAPGIWAGAVLHLTHAFLQCIHAVYAGRHDHSRIEDILDGDRRLEGGAGVLGGPFTLQDRGTYLLP